jgi:hypothetical protein
MILIYTLLILILASFKLVLQARASALGRRYSSLARAVQALVQTSSLRGGLNRVDPGQTARQTLELGQLVQQRDQLEARHFAWQGWADKLGHWADRLRNWKGQKLPYTMGVADVWLVLTLIDHLGVGQLISTQRLLQIASALWR